MKMNITPSAFLFAAAFIALTTPGPARDFGVSTSSKGRGTKVETKRGGEAYVGPRGAAVETAGGTKAASGARGAAYSGENVSAAAGRRGAAYSGPNGSAAAVRPLPAGYIRTVPAGY